MPNETHAESGVLNVIVDRLNVRKGAPNTTAPIAQTLPKGQQVRYKSYVTDGQAVSGNSKWYQTQDGNYIWSGGVAVVSVDPPQTTNPGSQKTLSAAVGRGCPNVKDDVKTVQALLNAKGLNLVVDGIFGNNTSNAISNFQRGALQFSNPDGRVDVGGKTWQGLLDPQVKYTPPATSSGNSDFDTKYKDVIFQGSVFPDAPINGNQRITLGSSIVSKYLPAMQVALAGETKGLQLLCTIMAQKEGYYPGSRSYETNNPGNIGNTDSGSNVQIHSLEDGIRRQRDYVKNVAAGKHPSYPMGKHVSIKPFYSKEIANNPQYGLPPWLPGYEFTFTGQLDQFVKIYSTGARAGNSYLSMIISYLNANGMNTNAQSKIQDIIA